MKRTKYIKIKLTETSEKLKGIIDKWVELKDNQAKRFIDNDGSIKHSAIVRYYFRESIEGFKNKIKENEIDYEIIKRPLMILAGDLAFILRDSCEVSLDKAQNYLKDIRGIFAVKIGDNEFLRDSYEPKKFKKILNILENTFGIIELSGPEFEGSESLTEWRVINISRLEEFVKKKSINYILKQIFKRMGS